MATANLTKAQGRKNPFHVKFNATQTEMKYIRFILDRAEGIWKKHGRPLPDRLSLEMDLTACHSNGCPMDFKKLAAADDFNLMHDVVGIMNCIDRKTGTLKNFFLPRCSK